MEEWAKFILVAGLFYLTLACEKEQVNSMNVEGRFSVTHTYWELKLYTIDSGAYIKYEVFDTIDVHQNGSEIYLPHLSETMVLGPQSYFSLDSTKERFYHPENQVPSTVNKTNVFFYEYGDSIYINKFYDYDPYPIDQRFIWEGRKLE